MRSAILDLGSNSFHLLVADLDGHAVSPVFREREMLHLGRAVQRHGSVPDDARRAAVSTVARFVRLARHQGAEQIRAVATSALREAANSVEVIDELSLAAGSPVRVLDGVEEAAMAYLGVRSAVAVRFDPLLVLDLGGGSLELAGGEDGRISLCASAPLGASRLWGLTDSDPLTPEDIALLCARVDEELQPLLGDVRTFAPSSAVAVGGAVRAIARIVAAQDGVWLPATLNQFELGLDRLRRLTDELLAADLDTRTQVPGMKERRADHLHVGALVLTRSLELLDLERVTVSDWGLREGALLRGDGVTSPPSAVDLRVNEVARVRGTFSAHDPHPTHVAGLATRLFDCTFEMHGLEASDRELLGHAAALHTVGESIALRRQHLHGAYLIENAEIHGFSPQETAVLTTLVRFHKSRGITRSYAPFKSLDGGHQKRTEVLLALLQVADALDQEHDQAVSITRIEVTGDVLVVTVSGDTSMVVDDDLSRRSRLFTRLFDLDVSVRPDGV